MPSTRTLARLLGLAVAAGAAAGLLGVALTLLARAGLDRLVAAAATGGPARALLVLAPAVGGLACALLVLRAAPEVRGPGSIATIAAVTGPAGRVRSRVALLHPIGALLTLALGGSAGREGPMMHAGAAVGSALATGPGLDRSDSRRLQTAAAAAGVTGAMNTPVAAALLVTPLLLRGRTDARAVAAIALAVCTAAGAHRLVAGPGPLFAELAPIPAVTAFPTWPPFTVVALLVPAGAAVGLGYVVALRTTTRAVQRWWPGPRRLDPAFGGLAGGLLLLVAPQVAGSSDMLTIGPDLAATTAWVLVGLLLAKIVATAVGTGFGGSGGVIGPLFVVGVLLGEVVGRAAGSDDGSARVLGVAAAFAAASRLPAAAVAAAVELTGRLDLTPAAIAVAVGSALVAVCITRVTLFTPATSPGAGADGPPTSSTGGEPPQETSAPDPPPER